MICSIIFLLNCRYTIVMLFILGFYKAICETLHYSEYIYVHVYIYIGIYVHVHIYTYIYDFFLISHLLNMFE